MIVEEKKADEKVCCGPNIEVGIGCAGSRCMAWRWQEITAPEIDRAGVYIRREVSTTHGYCGLAGRP